MFDLPELKYNGGPALAPQTDDLKRLYDLIIENFCLTVLEFGCGYSTFVIAKALELNRERWDALEDKPEVRNSQMFMCHSVDTDENWLKEVARKMPSLSPTVLKFSPCYTGLRHLMAGQMCHYYGALPDIVPDFIYIDGPDPAQVEGDVNGMTFKDRTPMSADLLLMEPTLIPGTAVLVDGRTNNARFLERSFKRQWTVIHNAEHDYTFMELSEARLGKINTIGLDMRDSCEQLHNKN